MNHHSSSSELPRVRRTQRRDWGRLLARIVCVLLALAALVPASVGLLVRTSWARGHATRETAKLLSTFGVDAKFDLDISIWPLAVSVKRLRVEASDGGSPFLTADRVTARPKIFGLLAGKVVLDQIEIERPKARIVFEKGELKNLRLDLPKTPKSDKAERPPFSVVSTTEAELDVVVDGIAINAHEVDADITTDDDGAGGTAFEVALRMVEARTSVPRRTKGKPKARTSDEPSNDVETTAYDDDTLCRVDGRVRIEPKRILVRRLNAFGAADLDPAANTHLGCDIAKTDKRYVELGLGHLSVTLSRDAKALPTIDGHVKARAPLPLLGRLPGAPDTDGWVAVDAELRYSPNQPLPDVDGRLEVQGVRVMQFAFARSIKSELSVHNSVVRSKLTRIEIADGVAEIRDVEVEPLGKGMPTRVGKIDVRDVNFTSLMRDLGVSKHPHVAWELREVHAAAVKGTLDPLFLDGDLNAKTYDFLLYDAPVESATKTRAIGVKEGALHGKLAIRPSALEFHDITVNTTKSVITGILVSIGFHDAIRVEVQNGKIDLADITPLGSVHMAGKSEVKARISGKLGNPLIEGDVKIEDFVVGEIPFGTVTQGHVRSQIDELVVELSDVRAVKGKSPYEMSSARLDFGGAAAMRFDGHASSKALGVRDFFSMFKLDEDPRLAEIDGTLDTNARVHLSLGGPEDVCKGGYLDVQATTNAKDLTLLGEKFEDGHADFDYRWIDREAGIQGAEIEIRSLSLTKVKKEGRAPLGAVLGSVAVHRGGELRGSLVVQAFPLSRTNLIGPAASALEGTVSGVTRISGNLDSFDVDSDLDVTPVRVLGAPFGGSELHVTMTQRGKPARVVGKTPCGAPITEAFNKEAWLKDTSSQGEVIASGALFGGQVKLDKLTMTRQKAPVVSGHVVLDKLDLAPLARIATTKPTDEDPGEGSSLGGELSGDVLIDRIATNDMGHAKIRFAPKTVRITRGGQKLELRAGAPTLALEDDAINLPKLTFDLAAPNGFRGAFSVGGAIRKVMHGGDLALDAQLYPIDLGILVGMVPKVTRAFGTLTGSVKIAGSPVHPDFDGEVKVRGGELSIKGLPGGITDIELDAVADENEARVTRATGRFLGGDVSVTARMPLKGGQFGVARAVVTGRQLSLAPVEGVKAVVDADLEVTMNPNATTAAGKLPFVSGEVSIASFEYSRPITVDLTGFKGGAKRTIVEAYDPSLDAIAFGFDVRSKMPLRIRNNLIDAQLAIDPRGIHVSGTNQRIGLRGEMSAVTGGRFRVFANDFEVQKGVIRFDDPTRIAPHVDVTAVTEYRRYNNTVATSGTGATNTTGGAGVTTGNISSGGRGGGLWRIQLHAYGDTEDLKVDMTSDPALSREDIFFLLTIGLTRAEVDQVRAGSVYASAAFEALGTVSGADRAVKKALPVIDDFRFGSAYSARTGRTEPQVTLGRRLTDNVRANVSTGLTEDRQLRSNVEWRLSRPLSVQTSYDNISTVSSGSVGNFGLDFRWRLEFD